MVQPQPPADQVQAGVDVLGGPLRAPSWTSVRALLVQMLELGLARQDRVHGAQQPVEVEVEADLRPLLELGLHGLAAFGPLRADLRQRQVALGELGAAAVDAVEDIHHHVERLVGAGHLLDVQIDVGDAQEPAQAAHVLAHLRRELGLRCEARDELAQPRGALAHQLRHVDPERVALHLHRLVEREALPFEVEAQRRERLRIAIEEPGRLAAHHAVERRHSLLTVQQQLHHARRQRAVAAMDCGLRLRRPDQQAPDRMAAVERVEEPAHLVAVPDVAALELGQRHVPAVDVVEHSGDLHTRRVLPVSSSCIIACFRSRVLSRRASRAVSSASMSERTAAIALCSATEGRRISTLATCARFVA